MKLPYLNNQAIETFIKDALHEDIGDGDHSSLGAIPSGKTNTARLIIKDDGILAGMDLAVEIFRMFDSQLRVEPFLKDGDHVKFGDIGLHVTGNAASILSAERLVLNCMQRMSGIATKTNALCQLIAHTGTRLLDTRKTTPNARLIEKWAVAIGGGQNHRFGLFDMVMLKDNHVDFAGGIPQAIRSTRDYLEKNKLDLKIEIETRSLEEVQAVLDEGGVDIIMLDNFELGPLRQAIELIGNRFKTEASGGITETTIKNIAETGVDYISVGALTHSYQSLDISLKAINNAS